MPDAAGAALKRFVAQAVLTTGTAAVYFFVMPPVLVFAAIAWVFAWCSHNAQKGIADGN